MSFAKKKHTHTHTNAHSLEGTWLMFILLLLSPPPPSPFSHVSTRALYFLQAWPYRALSLCCTLTRFALFHQLPMCRELVWDTLQRATWGLHRGVQLWAVRLWNLHQRAENHTGTGILKVTQYLCIKNTIALLYIMNLPTLAKHSSSSDHSQVVATVMHLAGSRFGRVPAIIKGHNYYNMLQDEQTRLLSFYNSSRMQISTINEWTLIGKCEPYHIKWRSTLKQLFHWHSVYTSACIRISSHHMTHAV